ncbi:MAG: PhzF family phenazine biosynthesis protein [Opitutaceae bacterium]|nr:PhzF family phenazine biosynthesis protein [Opitutaceae bacterium]
MTLPLYWVDAFASKPFTGNPAAVVPLDQWLDKEVMQKIAFENGLAETAFFVPSGVDRYHLRWFTPSVEVDLCGHATLASAHVLFNVLRIVDDRVTFDSRSGPLVVMRAGESLELDFPALETNAETCPEMVSSVIEALGATAVWIGRTPYDFLALVENAHAVRTLRPDMLKVAELGGRGIIVTAPGVDGAHFVSRFFAPQAGVPEDPVTGSAHCALVPFWAARLGGTTFLARQLSARGGELACTLAGSRVRLAGTSFLYMEAKIHV